MIIYVGITASVKYHVSAFNVFSKQKVNYSTSIYARLL